MAVKDEQAGSGRSKLFRTKSIEQSIKDTDEPETKLRKELNSWDLTVFGVAVVIGAGIFTLTARTAGNVAGPSVSLAFVIAAIACGLAALCYAEFASTVPVAGSAYTFSYATFGEFVAWIIGWDLILEFALASSVVAKGWSLYLGEVMGSRSPIVELGPISFDWGAVLVIAVITILLATGTKLSSRVSLVITAIKVAVVLLVIIVGLFYIDTDNYSPYIPPSQPGRLRRPRRLVHPRRHLVPAGVQTTPKRSVRREPRRHDPGTQHIRPDDSGRVRRRPRTSTATPSTRTRAAPP
ncbi:amino acid permease, partial [Streptomyces sp. NPDC002130]|uniref:APC family permease n=1 Tax=Streptomyces sp. NPDC002130 TaxID=3155568 RepID=UPI00331E8811